jgi:NADP-dependent 3-hydroxy acid dehydrogenase YdfG
MTSPPWKTALVTGASSGLGRGLALWLTRRGVKVWAAARRTEQLEALRAEAGELLQPLRLDVSDAAATFEQVRALDGQSGGLDLVIANAGVGEKTSARELDFASVNRMIQVNVAGASATLCGALPGMVARRRGHLVGISSMAGLLAFPGSSTYCASKAYLKMFLDGLRLDVTRYGIDVTSIHPGFVKSEMTDRNEKQAMPFLMETAPAIELMGRAMVQRRQQLRFPWQIGAMVRLAGALPVPWWNALARVKARKR